MYLVSKLAPLLFRGDKKEIRLKRQYLSLIEVLIVTALLIALALLVFPSLKKTMQMAKTHHCQSNLRQISYAMSMYALDYSKFVLFRKAKSDSTDPRAGHSVFWDDMLGEGYDGRNLSIATQDRWYLSYLRNEMDAAELYHCPNDKIGNLREFDSGINGFETKQSTGLGRSYSINSHESWAGKRDDQKQGFSGALYGSVTGVNRFLPWSQDTSSIINPSLVFQVVERPGAGWIGGGGGAITGNTRDQDGFGDIRWWQNNRGLTPVFENIRYHQDGYNYMFADGHVQNMIPEDTHGPTGTEWSPKGYWSIRVTD